MKLRVACTLACLLTLRLSAAPPTDGDALSAQAERYYAEGSFARAHEIYQQIDLTNLPAAGQRRVQFRLADTQWRAEAATQTADTTRLDDARRQLELLVRDTAREEEHDALWADVQESLGDFHWTRRNNNNWGEAWPCYRQALDWWAGARDIGEARSRYLAMVWRMARPPQIEPYYYYGYWGNYVPADVLENALKIALTDNDRAHAHYLMAMTLRAQAVNGEQRARIPEEFEAAIKIGRTSDWYDDAVYNYAEWMAGQGRIIPLENGGWRAEPDYVKALELFRRLVHEFSKGESRYWEQAQQQIRNITEPQVGVSVPNIFLPDSVIQYVLNWRNVKQIDLALYAVELNRDVKFHAEDKNSQNWLSMIDLNGRQKIKSWIHNALPSDGKGAGGEGNYTPGYKTLRLDGTLKPGAYILTAEGGGRSARELVLVTDATLVLKTSGRKALIYVCNALDGSPLPGAKVRLWESWWENKLWRSRAREGKAGDDGIAVLELAAGSNQPREIFASATVADRQAFCAGDAPGSGGLIADEEETPEDWRIYAFTDRPAYRPKETINWKFIARRYDGSVYSTPSQATVEFDITDPQGAKIKTDKVKLNAFGSAWGTLELTEHAPLGEYEISFWDKGRRHQIGAATLFRLEEYKLPEFKVTVQTPEEDGRKKAFRLGEKVEATIQADYYFGGPVANAGVEILVHQSPYEHVWHEPRSYAWLYEGMDNGRSAGPGGRWYGGDQIIKRETLKTDATGKATLSFESPANGNQDFEYRIEARVTDASRREIIGNGTVRVTRQRYYVYPVPEHNLYLPQDKVTVNFKALDANEEPVPATGSVKVTRDHWFEIWLAPDGHEVKGDELKRFQAQNKAWPPAPARPDQKNWRLKFQGYEHDDILTQTLKTDTNGEATLTFTPGREGYYRIVWTSDDAVRNTPYAGFTNHITGETAVWAGNGRTTELGYRSGGVEIIADKDTFRVGQKAPVMLVTSTSGRYVLFSVEGDDLYHHQLVHLDGTTRLIELPVEETYVPNMFLNAALVNDRQIFMDTKQIVVPPTKNFITVDVKPDRAQYQPQEEGWLNITTRNDEGKPVSAEVALGLVDESVYYIQSDYAGDPREFFFGVKRAQQVQTQATMNQKNYAKLVEWDNEQVVDERDRERMDRQKEFFINQALYRNSGGFGGVGGGGGALDDLSYSDAKRKDSGFEANSVVTAGGVMSVMPATPLPGEANGPMLAEAATGLAAGKSALRHGETPGPVVVVRSDFRSTVFWQPDVVTDQEGRATVKVKYPDSLTSWKATARAVTRGNQVGIAEAPTKTKQPLIVRLEAPRFFVVGDTVTISAVVNNNTDEPMEAKVALESQGIAAVSTNAALVPILGNISFLSGGKFFDGIPTVKIAANGEARVDWTAHVDRPGELRLKVTGQTGKYSDGMEKTYASYEHGIEKFISKSGKARGGEITVKLDLPSARKSDSTSLTVQVTPSLAVTMLDALPYLIDYPYGCTEQTMSRFLPATVTAKTLRDLGLKPEEVMSRVFGGIETNSAAATHPKGKRDLAELDRIERASLDRLSDFQHADGGWGWWKEGGSDHWMTAYVVWGLALARDAGIDVKPEELRRAAGYLDKTLIEEEENPDLQAFMLHALAAYTVSQKQSKLTKFEQTAFDNLWNKRAQLNAYTRALLALSAHGFGFEDKARILIANLENGVKRDNRPDASVLISSEPSTLNPQPSTLLGTAHWGEDGIFWRWSEGGVEATAFALRALLAIDPTNHLVEPVMNWLVKNRRGAQWNNTRDTAIVVLALNDYLRQSGELKTDLDYELIVNGTSIATQKISAADRFNAPSRFAIDPGLIRDHNEIQIKSGRVSPNAPNPALYFAVEAKFFSTEEPVTPAGNEIFVKREYYKRVGRPTLLKGYVYDQVLLADGDTVKSGERIETVLTIEAKNNYEYLLFEDLKPAGFEAVEIRSGESLYARELKRGAVDRKFMTVTNPPVPAAPQPPRPPLPRGPQRILSATGKIAPRPVPIEETDYTERQRSVYEELRDRQVALFIDKLPQGVWEIRYEQRAEAPGHFHALPVLGRAMYVPEIRGNSSETRVNVEEAD